MTQTGTTSALSRLALVAAMAALLALALSWAIPAAAFIEEEPGEQDTTQQDTAPEEPTGSAADDGFVEVEGATSAPTGGVDAGFGGTASSGGLGMVHAVAAALIGLTAVGHVVRVRRFATADV